MKTVMLYDAKPYDRRVFDEVGKEFAIEISYFIGHLDADTARLAETSDAVCAFVNDTIDESVIEKLEASGIRLIALRSAGYNNVDLKSAYRRIHIMRVPAYSPHAVAEHTMALILSLNRKTHRAYYRTRDTTSR